MDDVASDDNISCSANELSCLKLGLSRFDDDSAVIFAIDSIDDDCDEEDDDDDDEEETG
jgi:hypothetical protein